MSKLGALEDELDAAAAAFTQHVKSGIVTWYGETMLEPPEKPRDSAWMEQYHELRAQRNNAEAALLDYMTGGSRTT